MVAKLKDGLEQVKYKWQEASSLVKKAIVLFTISVILVGGFVFYLVTKVNYGVLFSDLSSADAGIISQDLKEKKIPYQLKDNGKTILIPQTEIDEYRIDLAVDNKLPDSTSGFELFDDASIMTTDEDRKIMYQRALTGELQRAILSLEDVEKVKVILVTPDEDLFASSQKDATASIILTLKKELSQPSIQGIIALTTGAVENLKVENVKVVDSNGQILSSTEEEDDLLGGTGANSKYMELKRAYEESLEQKVERLLEPIYGSEMAKVSINVDLDFDSTESTRTTYANPEIRSENIQATGSGEDIERAQTGQVNDNVTNVTGDDNQGNSSFNRIINNELDTEVVTTISAPGMIRRMTSSIVVSANVPADVQTELEALVASAIGFDEERGDSIAVQGIDFNKGVAVEEEVKKETNAISDNLNQYLLYFVIISGIFSTLLIAILLFVLFRRRRKEEEDYLVEEELEEATAPVTPTPIFESLAPETEVIFDESSEQKKQHIASEQAMKQKRKDDAAKKYALENPEVAAELIKSWLKDIK